MQIAKLPLSSKFPLLTLAIFLPPELVALIGCGGSMGTMQNQGGMTNVTVLRTGTANDQLTSFRIEITSLILTDKAGKSVTLLDDPGAANDSLAGLEFMNLNGAYSPLVSAAIPQGTYTSATLLAASCQFANVSITPAGGLMSSYFSEKRCSQGTGLATVNLASPLVILGTSEILSLDLQVSQSYTLTTTQGSGGPTQSYTISPVFTLGPLSASTQPSHGLVAGIDVQVASVNSTGNGFAATTPKRASLSVVTNAATVYQGLPTFSSIASGMLANLDAAVQTDGSLLATRIQVDDPTAIAEFTGPWTFSDGQPGSFVILPQGCFHTLDNPVCDSGFQSTNGATFSVSGEFTNLQSLPFTASFTCTSLSLGQNLSGFSQGARDSHGVPIVTTISLRPQTINGTIAAVSTINGFSVYTVSLASYDLIPIVQAAAGPASQDLANPASVTVYAGANTQLSTTALIGVGSLARFRGIIFNDNGVLRMDCQKILDGVPE
ncbi:MAG TPA: hypothetical protein VMI10_14015 [Terriglobales bacterium]|nr:hypothetical protein [Terriglobales bacterium]